MVWARAEIIGPKLTAIGQVRARQPENRSKIGMKSVQNQYVFGIEAAEGDFLIPFGTF
jgi:hypothetical protein